MKRVKEMIKMAVFMAVSVILSAIITVKFFGMDGSELFQNLWNDPKLDWNLLGMVVYLLLIGGFACLFLKIDEKMKKLDKDKNKKDDLPR